ncbi:uncharacterized protein AKAW2_50001S [Aspergillus luchuensis]|uniref:HC-toxin synthetase n=1 Tax=Aspergillus kawachii TaxID=1069201 RepID=A0A146EZD5_ASPKA|nr:uncharacterized protein AKAW2_50001S [Aspergillus luchuensis]BCR99659.1 hypothetical protein AKAW2_50001S [Aspergillus luchuensis]BCS11955.1 hypothetical protein ALUC_50001S [Aspergillus luchuensis]GAA92984.1 HC-toxin synthetase [Aspergillus luchuensis IFO 4308]GAT19398.1 HC-toxin synthetase [Aspergillus luchuensis]
MLGILKAGGAFVPLDPSQPQARLNKICREIQAKLILVSLALSHRPFSPIGILTVDHCSLCSYRPNVSVTTNSENAAYILFTSGSTGRPKGVVVPHTSFASSASYHSRSFLLGPEARVLQFSSLTFDASLCEILSTLLFGGCICIPSENQRMDEITSVMRTLRVNYALLTPSVARLVNPNQVPSLSHLILMGEKPCLADLQQWCQLEGLMIGYGPTECSVCCTVATSWAPQAPTGSIGKPVGCTSWVTSSHDHNRLAPIGAEGELLIKGLILARGYLNNPDKTMAFFIENPG